jgi:hypothetical protein
MSNFIDPPFCNNIWCSNKKSKNIPTTGLHESESQCSDMKHLIKKQLSTGGLSGRGVIPCIFGYVETNVNGEKKLYPLEQHPFIAKNSTIEDPIKPGYSPPQFEPRSLIQIGNVYRN